MTFLRTNIRTEIMDKIIEMVHKKLDKQEAGLVADFAHVFFHNVALADLSEHSISELFGALLSQWNFINHKNSSDILINIFNPVYEGHGWESTHSIIQVVSDDMPFLVDTTMMEINRLNYTIHLTIHGGSFRFERDKSGAITKVYGLEQPVAKNIKREAIIYMEIDRQNDPVVLAEIKENLTRVLADVHAAVDDWLLMKEKVSEALEEVEKISVNLEQVEIDESKDFLRWLNRDNFTFLGYREYTLTGSGENLALDPIAESSLGVLRRDEKQSFTARNLALLPPEAKKLALSSQILIISKTNTESTVHRRTYTDYIGVKRFDEQGKLIGERRIIGLFTSGAYNSSLKSIPFLRMKVSTVMAKSKVSETGHTGKDLLNILETLPRDDVIQSTPDELLELAMGISQLQERKRIRLFVRKDVYGRFMSCLVYLPREWYNTDLVEAFHEILQTEFNGRDTTYATRFCESILARLHFTIRIDPQDTTEYNVPDIEKKLIDAARSWRDELTDLINEHFGEEQGSKLARKYPNTFPAGYREHYAPLTAIHDIEYMETLSEQVPLTMAMSRPIDEDEKSFHLKLFQREISIPLSDALPVFENMGLRVLSERPFALKKTTDKQIWINDFALHYRGNEEFSVIDIKEIFHDAFANIWFGQAENDSFNQLVIAAKLSWREISIIRAYAKYLRQAGINFSQNYIEKAIVKNASIAAQMVQLFTLRFDPAAQENSALEITRLEAQIEKDLDSVDNLDEDRILRRFINIIHATVRTNYFQTNEKGQHKEWISFKFEPERISDLPLPRPMFEIFVYSPRMEGVHLRSSKVARGGLRWSDRLEDFRTEVLGLMKAQAVKNSVIVPTGAKGGFVCKNLPAHGTRDEIQTEVIYCYRTFIRGLLDVTDNLVEGGEISKPANVVCYDEDDHYLVVAADKGTATFSDTANAIAQEYNFWLGDAFASGGSVGYDHKKMAITARGGWESVKRHFRSFGIDTQTQPFTVVGIGDMAGDVFGNGMMLSEQIKLVGAFNHMHIFVDPNPDPATSFVERKRLFNMPRSTWADYNQELISKGGGVFLRSAKSIKLTPEMKELLQVNRDYLVPNDLIRALLKAEVDLLWNGGIGTYVKAESELHSNVGDRANDNLRVNGNELRCRVVGEGGNLGFTQLGRVEYELNGGVLYTDFIDNSAGVDCSDHEVNIKILLNGIVAKGDLTVKQRNQLLAEMTDEVATLVLRNNYSQTQAIDLAASQARADLDLYARYIYELERIGRLNRHLEFLPDEKAIIERKAMGKGLTRPEIAVLFAYTKNVMKQLIISSDVPENPYLSGIIETSFPKVLKEKYNNEMIAHSLRREIIVTQLINDMVDKMGVTFVHRLHDETGAPVHAIVRAYAIASGIFDVNELWRQVEQLDLIVPVEVQERMMSQIINLIRRITRWFLRNRRVHLDIGETINKFLKPVELLKQNIRTLISKVELESVEEIEQYYLNAGISEPLASRFANLAAEFSLLDIIDGARLFKADLMEYASIFYALNDYLELAWFRQQIGQHPVDTHWDALSKAALRDDVDWQQRELASGLLAIQSKEHNVEKRIHLWSEQHQQLINRWHQMLADLRGVGSISLTMFAVASRELLDLAQASLHGTKPQVEEIN